MVKARKQFSMSTKVDDENRGAKRRRSSALPDTISDLPDTKKIKETENIPEESRPETPDNSMQVEIPAKPVIPEISELERRKRLREILHIILTKLKKKVWSKDCWNFRKKNP